MAVNIRKVVANKVFLGDCRESMVQMIADGLKVQTCITSPPYYGLRSYLPDDSPIKELELGNEETPAEFVQNLVEVFRLVRELLTDDGTAWLNLGDSYYNYRPGKGQRQGKQSISGGKAAEVENCNKRGLKLDGYKEKDLMGIPWEVAFALRADGWYLRQEIIWSKPNSMVESVRDRCTKSHEHIFLLTKSKRYFYDNEAIKTPVKQDWGTRDRTNGKYSNEGSGLQPHSGLEKSYTKANKRSVWSVSPASFKGSHFAVMPVGIVEPAVLAGTSEKGHCPKCYSRWVRITNEAIDVTDEEVDVTTLGWEATCDCKEPPVPDIVFDPFLGSGTVAEVALTHGRHFLGCELNQDYLEFQDKRQDEVWDSKRKIDPRESNIVWK